jgi:hypothetical protein
MEASMSENRVTGLTKFLGIAAATVVMLSSTSNAAPIHQAYSISGGTLVGNQSYTDYLGLDFDVNADHIKITDLGFFDSNDDGVQGSGTISVSIYDRTDTSSALATQSFTIGDSGMLMNGFRFKSIPTLVLGSGQYSILAIGFSSDDPNGNENVADIPLITDDGNGALTFVDSRFGTFFPPTTTVNSQFACNNHQEACFAAGSFKYTVPEPGTLALFGLSLAGLAAVRRRKAA